MNNRSWRVPLLVALAATLLAAVIAEPALAQTTTNNGGSTTDIGKNLGGEVSSWAKALLLGVAALVGLPALAKRDLGQSMVVALITIVLGGFIFASDTVESIINTLWSTLGQ